MGGGNKRRLQNQAQQQSAAAAERERAAASGLQTELQKRKDIVGTGLSQTMAATRAGAEDLRNTGGFGTELQPIQQGYSDLATTGGFSPREKEAFLRRSTAPANAVYSNARDQLQRQKALSGGYTPGFGASASRITRQAANVGSEASLSGNVELANQIRAGRTAGLAGEERIAGMVQQGRIAGQDALQRYSQFGASALNDIDINEMRNRLQTGQMTQFDAQLLTTLAAQNKTLFENIMQGISTIGGAAAGVLTGIGDMRGGR